MRFSIRFADKIVGALVVFALAVLIVVVFMLGRSQRWFKYDYEYITYFEDAKGLSKNMAVQYKGFTIGNVKDFKLADDDTVEVIFTVFEEYRDRWVKEGSLVEIAASPIPGFGNSFSFHPGRGAKILDEFSLIPDVNSGAGKNYIALGLSTKTDSSDSITDILNHVNKLLATINIALEGSDAEGKPSLEQIIANIETLTNGIAAPDGAIMRILDGEGPVYADLAAAVNSVSGILDDVNRSTHVLPAQLPIILNDLSVTLRELQDVIIAAANNPILKGGIPERAETGPGGADLRNLEF